MQEYNESTMQECVDPSHMNPKLEEKLENLFPKVPMHVPKVLITYEV